ncbi:MAG: lysophospholipid acyltransferase family protein [Anaerolineae bacterium]
MPTPTHNHLDDGTLTHSQSRVARPSAWYRSVRAVIRLLFFLLADYKVSGQEHIPDAGPMIIAINHMSAVDLPAVMLAIPHQATAFAASKYQGGLRGLILRSVHVIFVRRGIPDRKALRQALEVLQSGGVLGLAPEGTRSPTKTLLRAKPGTAFLAVRSGATVLPIGLTGTETVLRSWRHLHRPKIRVVIGEPYKLEASGNGRHDFQALSDQIMLSIAGLLPEEYRGEYAD